MSEVPLLPALGVAYIFEMVPAPIRPALLPESEARNDSAPYTLHPTPHTLHPKPYTLHPTPHSLHSAPFNLHSTGALTFSRGYRRP